MGIITMQVNALSVLKDVSLVSMPHNVSNAQLATLFNLMFAHSAEI